MSLGNEQGTTVKRYKPWLFFAGLVFFGAVVYLVVTQRLPGQWAIPLVIPFVFWLLFLVGDVSVRPRRRWDTAQSRYVDDFTDSDIGSGDGDCGD